MSAWVQVKVSLNILDRTIVIWVFCTRLIITSGVVTSIKVNFCSSLSWCIIFVKVVIYQILILILLIILLRIRNNLNLLCLRLIGLERLVWLHNDLAWHVGAILLWNNVLTWVQNDHLLKLLILVIMECLVLILILVHLLTIIHFVSDLHLWDGNDLVSWNNVVLLDWLHWHGVSVSILGALVGLKLVILLFDKLVLRWDVLSVLNLNILRFHILHDFLVLLQELSWWEVLSHYQASVRTSRSTWSSIGLLWLHFFNWIILLYLID